jgi:hypothetical protein
VTNSDNYVPKPLGPKRTTTSWGCKQRGCSGDCRLRLIWRQFEFKKDGNTPKKRICPQQKPHGL